MNSEKANWISGVNLLTDAFREVPHSTTALRNYGFTTYGLFAQNTWTPTPLSSLETGLRGDYVKPYGWALLPRLSALLKLTSKVTTRLGGGFGYKIPTIFTEDAERMEFQNILPITEGNTESERSVGGNLDFNYRTRWEGLGFAWNQLFSTPG